MYLICTVPAHEKVNGITTGDKYEMLRSDQHHYWIINNMGEELPYLKGYFEDYTKATYIILLWLRETYTIKMELDHYPTKEDIYNECERGILKDWVESLTILAITKLDEGQVKGLKGLV